MKTTMWILGAILAITCALLVMGCVVAEAQIVKYTDEQGQSHYVGAPDQVPTKYKTQARDLKNNAPKQTVILPPSQQPRAVAGEWNEDGADHYGLYTDTGKGGDGAGFHWVKSYETLAECSAAAKAMWLSSKHATGCRGFFVGVEDPRPSQPTIEIGGSGKTDYRRRIGAGETVTDRKRIDFDQRATIMENCLRMAMRFKGSMENCKP